jgi:hypothetical protein
MPLGQEASVTAAHGPGGDPVRSMPRASLSVRRARCDSQFVDMRCESRP